MQVEQNLGDDDAGIQEDDDTQQDLDWVALQTFHQLLPRAKGREKQAQGQEDRLISIYAIQKRNHKYSTHLDDIYEQICQNMCNTFLKNWEDRYVQGQHAVGAYYS